MRPWIMQGAEARRRACCWDISLAASGGLALDWQASMVEQRFRWTQRSKLGH